MAASGNMCTFLTAVERIITNWNSLKLAVENGMGGPRALEKVKWLTEVIDDLFCKENEKPYSDEVEDFIADILNNEFDTRMEDGSLSHIAQTLCTFYQIYSSKSKEEFEAAVLSLPISSLNGWKFNSQGSDSDEDDRIDDEQTSEMIPQMETQTTFKSEQDDDGWKVVSKRRNR